MKRRCAARCVQHSTHTSAATAALAAWQLRTSASLQLKKAVWHHATCMVSKSLLAWQFALSKRTTKQVLLQQACSHYMEVLCSRTFQAWLLYYAQCMRQQIVAHAAEEQHQQSFLFKALCAWHVLMQRQRAAVLQDMRAAMIFHTTYLQQATFTSWQGWVRGCTSTVTFKTVSTNSFSFPCVHPWWHEAEHVACRVSAERQSTWPPFLQQHCVRAHC